MIIESFNDCHLKDRDKRTQVVCGYSRLRRLLMKSFETSIVVCRNCLVFDWPSY